MSFIWKPIEGFERYQVSDIGEIKSFVQYTEGKILKHSYTRDGYPFIRLRSNSGDRKTFRVHRIVAIAFISNPNNLPEVNHIDGNKLNINVINLEWCTPRHNQLHAYATGLRKKMFGLANGATKLTEREVIDIREMLANNITRKEILSKFNIKSSQLYNIKWRHSWNHL